MTAYEQIKLCAVVDCFTWPLQGHLARQCLQCASENMPTSQWAVI